MQSSVKCGNCGAEVDVNLALKTELELEMKQKMAAARREFDKEIETKRAEYKAHLDALNAKEKEFDAKFAAALNAKKTELENEIKAKLEGENLNIVNALKTELEAKSKQINELNLKTLEIEKLKREKSEFESALMAKTEAELSKRLNEEKERLGKALAEQNELKFKQKDEQLEVLKKQLNEAQRRIEQGSEQLQGETQELAIEAWLREKFVFDVIDEVKKGANGADVMQIVNTREAQNCGKIYYESKRTKNFSNEWIEKFKADMRASGADVGVLVSEARPRELERMGLIDGVWVCNYEEIKNSAQNRSNKMEMLYSYLVSNEFKMRIEAIVEGFSAMSEELEREKNAMKRIWKSREKQIEKVRDNAIEMFGSIKGIAGNAIGEIKTLELGFDAGDFDSP